MFSEVLSEVLEFAEVSFGVKGAGVIMKGEKDEQGDLDIEARILANKPIVLPDPKLPGDLGVNCVPVAFAQGARRLREELGIDKSPEIKRGEMRARGEAAMKRGAEVYVVAFAGHKDPTVNAEIAGFGLICLADRLLR